MSRRDVGFRNLINDDLPVFDYAHWHTLDDTPDKCSPASLKAIGETVAEVIYREK